MGRLKDELLDPWGLMLAGVLGGLTWAVSAPVAVAVGVGAVVYGVKSIVGAVTRDGEDAAADGSPPPLPPQGTPARMWIQRAGEAVASLQRMSPGTPQTATDVASAHTAEEAAGVLQTMRRLGGQVVAIISALSHADAPGLDAEAKRLRDLARAAPQDQSAQQSADAVEDRLAVRNRLRAALTELDGRLQSSALRLEGLVARVAEVRAAAGAVGQVDPTSDDLAALTSEVEGLRVGLADVEQVAQQALGR
ncbi:MAG: hypothetical protein JWN31_1615 [Frankiales bacterium]|nr:hypothetical protein [Frankiales bacterium]